MDNGIQYFLEKWIPELEKSEKDFLNNPGYFDGYMEKARGIMLDFGCHIISEVLEYLSSSVFSINFSSFWYLTSPSILPPFF